MTKTFRPLKTYFTLSIAAAFSLGLAAFGPAAQAEIIKKEVNYTYKGAPLQGFLVYDTEQIKENKKNPGALIYHAWMGIGSHELSWATQLARVGYVVFTPDIYGKGVRPNTPQAAKKESQKYKSNPELMRGRALAGLEQLQNIKWVNHQNIGSLGFCFGGGVALELARSGAPVKATISLHGNLKTEHPEKAGAIKGAVLALHGAADPFVPMKEVAAFQQEMENGKVDWQMKMYGGAVHAFTDPGAGNVPARGAAYHPVAARKAWNDTLDFLFKNVPVIN